jgi:glycosyltransferase involved in cell wall biosynthesis
MSLRVLHVMSCRGWSSDAYWAGTVTRELQQRHRVTLVARADATEKVLRRLGDLGVQNLRTLTLRGRRSPRGTVDDLLAIRRLIPAYDVVHVHRGKEHWLAALANRLVREPIPLVRTRHIVHPVKAHALNRWLYRSATDHVIAVSDAIRRRYVETGLLRPDRVTALPGGVDHRRFHPDVDGTLFRQTHGLPGDLPVVGILGGLRPLKGHAVFLRAARLVLARCPAVRFLVIGGGGEAERVRRLVSGLGLERSVSIIGGVPDPERAVAALDVAVYAAIASDGMGRVLFEYMAMARPIVASAVGLAPEVLAHGESALLVPPREPDALARGIETVLTVPDLARRLGGRARQLVEERYSAAGVATAVERVYWASLTSGHPPPP